MTETTIREQVQQEVQGAYIAGEEGMPEETAVPSSTDAILTLLTERIEEMKKSEKMVDHRCISCKGYREECNCYLHNEALSAVQEAMKE